VDIRGDFPWKGDVKGQWGCRKRQFSVISLAIPSITLEMRPALLHSDTQSIVGFSAIPKCMTLIDLEWLFPGADTNELLFADGDRRRIETELHIRFDCQSGSQSQWNYEIHYCDSLLSPLLPAIRQMSISARQCPSILRIKLSTKHIFRIFTHKSSYWCTVVVQRNFCTAAHIKDQRLCHILVLQVVIRK